MNRMMHEESVYALVQPEAFVPPKPPMFRSKIGNVAPTASTFHLRGTTAPLMSNMAGATAERAATMEARTFGRVPSTGKIEPANFLRKYVRSSSVPSLAEVKRSSPDTLKPLHLKESRFAAMGGGGPPKRGEQPIMNLKSAKNFIVANAVEVILAAPKKSNVATVDYLKKEDYGRAPRYLSNIKNDISAEYDYIRQLQDQQYADSQSAVKPLDEEERLALLDALKAKWEQVNTEYQAAAHMTLLDTQGKVRRKEKNEAELSQLEKDIERLSKRNINVNMAC